MFGQRPILLIQDDTRHRLKQDLISRLKLVRTKHEYPIPQVHRGIQTHALDLAMDGVLQFKTITCILVIQDDQIDRDMVVAPIGKGLQDLRQQE